ncbi:hypothetical protein HHI36_006778 [Cryptolaemus montrouzieri]|uniref:Organic cation transporter protein n=1 Tax=Cryptolaemus montrouzieri TaxID=559131 RepID=A0ABD2NY35_9CUCU
MDFDDMLEELGELGKYQITVYSLVCLPVLFGAANSLSYVFTAGVTDYRCYVPECEEPQSTSYDTPWLKWAIPPDTTGDISGYKPSECHRYVPINTSETSHTCTNTTFNHNETEKCSEWIFSHDDRTIVNDKSSRMIPESVRWLLANEKRQKAKHIIYKVAKVNKVILSDGILDSFKESSALNEKEDDEDTNIIPVVKEMLRSKKMILRILIVYYIWAVNAFVYYGLSVNSTSMNGDKYINFALVSLVEIPGYTLAWVSIRKCGRRFALVGSLLLSGLTCTLTIWVPTEMTWATITLFLCGKLGITSAFGISYVYTAELLPTAIRSGGVGSASTIARVGAILAPFIPLLGVYMNSLPSILFGAVAISAGLIALKLPETVGRKLPETAKEATDL